MNHRDILQPRASGLYCPAGDFHIDPGSGVERAVITHGHGDHARPGSGQYFAASESAPILARRLAGESIRYVDYGVVFELGDARVSLHPAGHILGSAQVRVEVDGEVWVVSGDYKRQADPTCTAFEVVPCDTFITEATFALPVYRWPEGTEVARDLADWHHDNAGQGRCSVVFCYSLGKAQRLLAELAPLLERPVYLHGALQPLVAAYREAGVAMAATEGVDERRREDWAGELVMAPPSAAGSPWMRRFGRHRTGFVSGWMRIRGNRRRRGYDRGFVLSDHVDWPDLLATIRDTGARRVLATHGRSDILVRYLREVEGLEAAPLVTEWGDSSEAVE